MSGIHLCVSRNETVQPPCFQNRFKMFCIPIPTLIYLWENYIFSGSVCLFSCMPNMWTDPGKAIHIKIELLTDTWMQEWNWVRAILFLGIHKLDFRYSSAAVSLQATALTINTIRGGVSYPHSRSDSTLASIDGMAMDQAPNLHSPILYSLG
jgi:hypothetical protein